MQLQMPSTQRMLLRLPEVVRSCNTKSNELQADAGGGEEVASRKTRYASSKSAYLQD